jgi:hypothetical protein
MAEFDSKAPGPVRDRIAQYQDCLGAQAGEKSIARLAADAGYTSFRRAAETPFNIVYEARP